MPFYLFEAKYTGAAIRALVDKPQDREPPAKKLFEAAGAKMHSLFFTFGERDAVVLIEAPDDETMAACALVAGASGAFSSGATTKLMTSQEAMSAMAKAKDVGGAYVPATG